MTGIELSSRFFLQLGVIVGAGAHAAVHKSISMLGLGTDNIESVPMDDQGRMRPDQVPKLDEALAEVARQTGIGAAAVRKLFQLLRNSGEVLQVSTEFYFAASAIDELIAKIKLFAGSSSDRMIDVAVFKDIAGVSRKYAIPLLEYLDQRKITARRGDKRLII